MFTPNEFLDLGARGAVDTSLHRIVRLGTIRRIARGLYYYPEVHPLLGEVAPSIQAVAQALAEEAHASLQPSGAYAANLLGLSEQVPAKVVFLTNGTGRKVKIGKLVIELRKTTSRRVSAAGRTSGLVFAALQYLGKENVTADRIDHLRTTLSESDKKRLLTDISVAPAWMHSHLRAIAGAQSQ